MIFNMDIVLRDEQGEAVQSENFDLDDRFDTEPEAIKEFFRLVRRMQ